MGLFGLIRLPDLAAAGQFEFFLLPKPNPKHVSRLTHHGQKKTDLFVDGLRRGRLFQPIGLILEDRGFIDVNE
jgi:hypothetical protein